MEKNILKFFEDAPEALDEAELAKLNELMDEISFVEQFDMPDGKRLVHSLWKLMGDY